MRVIRKYVSGIFRLSCMLTEMRRLWQLICRTMAISESYAFFFYFNSQGHLRCRVTYGAAIRFGLIQLGSGSANSTRIDMTFHTTILTRLSCCKLVFFAEARYYL
jgi:hypothetical protein